MSKKTAGSKTSDQFIDDSPRVYMLEYDHWWGATFVVNRSKAAPACKASLDFFGDPITREDDSEHEYVVAFLKMLGRPLIVLSIDKTLEGILEEITSHWEGFFPLDGSQGVTLVRLDNWSFESDEFNVSQS